RLPLRAIAVALQGHLLVFASEQPLCFFPCELDPRSDTRTAGQFGSEPLNRGPSLIDDECTTICQTVFHAHQYFIDVVLRTASKAGMQARHNGPQRPGFVPVEAL